VHPSGLRYHNSFEKGVAGATTKHEYEEISPRKWMHYKDERGVTGRKSSEVNRDRPSYSDFEELNKFISLHDQEGVNN